MTRSYGRHIRRVRNEARQLHNEEGPAVQCVLEGCGCTQTYYLYDVYITNPSELGIPEEDIPNYLQLKLDVAYQKSINGNPDIGYNFSGDG